MMLGDISTADPGNIKDFLIIVGFLISTATGALALFSSRNVQRREVHFADEYVRREDCTLIHGRSADAITNLDRRMAELGATIERMRTEMREDFIDERKAAETRIGNVHERINQVLSMLGKMNGVP